VDGRQAEAGRGECDWDPAGEGMGCGAVGAQGREPPPRCARKWPSWRRPIPARDTPPPSHRGPGPPGVFFLLPSFGSLGFPPPVRPPRRRLETARDWGKFSRAFRRRRRRRQPIMESDGTGEVAGGIRFGSICQVCALAARAGACDAGSRAAPVRGREDSPC
jgi:hypothetical protein